MIEYWFYVGCELVGEFKGKSVQQICCVVYFVNVCIMYRICNCRIDIYMCYVYKYVMSVKVFVFQFVMIEKMVWNGESKNEILVYKFLCRGGF